MTVIAIARRLDRLQQGHAFSKGHGAGFPHLPADGDAGFLTGLLIAADDLHIDGGRGINVFFLQRFFSGGGDLIGIHPGDGQVAFQHRDPQPGGADTIDAVDFFLLGGGDATDGDPDGIAFDDTGVEGGGEGHEKK